MRLLRELHEEVTAQRLVDALADEGIAAELKSTATRHSVWVIDEVQLPRASELASGWLEGEQREAFATSAARGQRGRELSAHLAERRQRQVEALAQRLQALARPRPTPLTWGLIALCVALAFALWLLESRLDYDRDAMVAMLTIADPREPRQVTLVSLFGLELPWLSLPLAQPWRLVTPILVHAPIFASFGFLHILFNMLWLRDLGRMLEGVHGTLHLAGLVLLSAVISNVAQYEIGQQPQFAGMSGVVYALLGAVWLRGRLDPQVGYGLSHSTMQFMMIWFLLGFLGNFGTANWCHLFGLLVGLAWAYAAHHLQRVR